MARLGVEWLNVVPEGISGGFGVEDASDCVHECAFVFLGEAAFAEAEFLNL